MRRVVDRFRKCRACGDYHWTSAWPANHVEPVPQRSSLPSPGVILDTMDALFHPGTNQMIESKNEFRAATKSVDGIEIGNDEQKDLRYVDTVTGDDVAQAMQMVEQGYRPNPELASAEQTVASFNNTWENA